MGIFGVGHVVAAISTVPKQLLALVGAILTLVVGSSMIIVSIIMAGFSHPSSVEVWLCAGGMVLLTLLIIVIARVTCTSSKGSPPDHGPNS